MDKHSPNIKGFDFEEVVAKGLRRWFPSAKRPEENGNHAPDVINTPFYVECKAGDNKVSYMRRKRRGKRVSRVAMCGGGLNGIDRMYGHYHDKMQRWLRERYPQKPVVIVTRVGDGPVRVIFSKRPFTGGKGMLVAEWTDFARLLDAKYGASYVTD